MQEEGGESKNKDQEFIREPGATTEEEKETEEDKEEQEIIIIITLQEAQTQGTRR